MLSFVYCEDRPWMKITCSRFVSSRLLSERIKFKRKTDFLMWEKRVCCFENRLPGVKKKQTVRCFRKNTPKNQTEFNGIEAIYIVLVVVLTFTSSFFNYSLFYFILFFPSRLFQVRTCVPCVQVATPLTSIKFIHNTLNYRSEAITICLMMNWLVKPLTVS